MATTNLIKSNSGILVYSYMKIFLVICFCSFLTGPLMGQSSDSSTFQKALVPYQAALQAYGSHHYKSYLEKLEKVRLYIPGHSDILYAQAQAYALNNDTDKAKIILHQLVSMGLFIPVNSDTIFNAIKNEKEFMALQFEFERNKTPLVNSKRAFVLSEMDLANEGMAYDSKTHTFFVSSIHKRKIIAISKDGEIKDFSKPQDSLGGIYGMTVDPVRNQLWACSNAVPQMQGYVPSMEGQTFLCRYDLNTGKLLEKFFINDTLSKHQIKDVTVTSKGEIYFTDMAENTVYQLVGKIPVRIIPPGILAGALGLCSTDDGASLFISDFIQGVFKYSIANHKVERLPLPDNSTVQGIDGLYYHQGKLLAVQNGVNPRRVIQCDMNKEENRINTVTILEVNHPDYDWPTLGVIQGSYFYYVANSQWTNFSANGKVNDATQLKSPVILKLKL